MSSPLASTPFAVGAGLQKRRTSFYGIRCTRDRTKVQLSCKVRGSTSAASSCALATLVDRNQGDVAEVLRFMRFATADGPRRPQPRTHPHPPHIAPLIPCFRHLGGLAIPRLRLSPVGYVILPRRLTNLQQKAAAGFMLHDLLNQPSRGPRRSPVTCLHTPAAPEQKPLQAKITSVFSSAGCLRKLQRRDVRYLGPSVAIKNCE